MGGYTWVWRSAVEQPPLRLSRDWLKAPKVASKWAGATVGGEEGPLQCFATSKVSCLDSGIVVPVSLKRSRNVDSATGGDLIELDVFSLIFIPPVTILF